MPPARRTRAQSKARCCYRSPTWRRLWAWCARTGRCSNSRAAAVLRVFQDRAAAHRAARWLRAVRQRYRVSALPLFGWGSEVGPRCPAPGACWPAMTTRCSWRRRASLPTLRAPATACVAVCAQSPPSSLARSPPRSRLARCSPAAGDRRGGRKRGARRPAQGRQRRQRRRPRRKRNVLQVDEKLQQLQKALVAAKGARRAPRLSRSVTRLPPWTPLRCCDS